jgi:hypothetical protein
VSSFVLSCFIFAGRKVRRGGEGSSSDVLRQILPCLSSVLLKPIIEMTQALYAHMNNKIK